MFDLAELRELAAESVLEEQRRGTLVLDIRHWKQFASFHLPGSLQIGLSGSFASWSAIMIEPKRRLLLVVEGANDAREAQIRLARVGIEGVIGYLLADGMRWRDAKLPLEEIAILGNELLHEWRQQNAPFKIVDVRSRAEWLKDHLAGSSCEPLQELDRLSASRLAQDSKPAIIYCREGYRAMIAASLLLRHGLREVMVLPGGIEMQLTDELTLSPGIRIEQFDRVTQG
jgi:rhodanese-related sulfurtransferase